MPFSAFSHFFLLFFFSFAFFSDLFLRLFINIFFFWVNWTDRFRNIFLFYFKLFWFYAFCWPTNLKVFFSPSNFALNFFLFKFKNFFLQICGKFFSFPSNSWVEFCLHKLNWKINEKCMWWTPETTKRIYFSPLMLHIYENDDH